MNNRFILIFIFISTLSFAQLSIRNSAYVFINDEIVFVNDDINLNEANSKIYLRNEAQVIQGTGTSGNSGIGELSVYQEANVDEYDYNYWCSPIGSKTNNSINNPFGISFLNDVTGLITSIPATFVHNSNYNGTSSPLNIEPYWIWKFIASDTYFEWIHVEGNTTINPGEGFTMKGTAGSGSAQQYDFRGKPNNGEIAVSVLTNQYTLVGNPYPSAMDARAYIWDSENALTFSGTLYYWEQNPAVNSHYIREYDGGYGMYTIDISGATETYIPATFNTYNGDGSININNTGTGTKTARRYIPIGQGFMVEGTANGVVKAKNSHRFYVKESAANSEFFKTTNIKGKSNNKETENRFSIVPEDYKRFRLNIDFNNTYTRQIAQTFHATATEGFDRGLEIKISDTDVLSSDANWIIKSKSYVAQALPFDEAMNIPLHIKVANNMPLKVTIADIQNFESSQPIYMHDIENDQYIDLKSQDFNINLLKGDYTNRFEITFNKNNALSVNDANIEDFKLFQNNTTAELTLANTNLLQIKTFQLFDASGKMVIHQIENTSKKQYSYSTKFLSNGVYIAKIILDSNQVLSKKLIISNKK